jgi:hypothetical protein
MSKEIIRDIYAEILISKKKENNFLINQWLDLLIHTGGLKYYVPL